MNLLFRVFLSLSFLVLNGYSYVYADSAQQDQSHAQQDIVFFQTDDSSSVSSLGPDTGLNNTPSASEKNKERIYVEETEDTGIELILFRKCPPVNNYFSAFYSPVYGLCQHVKKRLLFGKHFSYLPSNKLYIYIEVFRI